VLKLARAVSLKVGIYVIWVNNRGPSRTIGGKELYPLKNTITNFRGEC